MAAQSAEFTFGLLLSTLALLRPPGLLLAALWFGGRWLRRRYFPPAPPVV